MMTSVLVLLFVVLLVFVFRITEPAKAQVQKAQESVQEQIHKSRTVIARKLGSQEAEEAYIRGAYYGFLTMLDLARQGWRVRETVNGGLVAQRGDELCEIYWSEKDRCIKMAAMFAASQPSRNGNGHKHVTAAEINAAFDAAVANEQYTN